MEWISVKDRLPENQKVVLCIYKEGKRDFHCASQYFKEDVMRECWNEDCEHEDHETNDNCECRALGGNWYEEIEQYASEYDSYLFKRNVTHWMIPEPPKD